LVVAKRMWRRFCANPLALVSVVVIVFLVVFSGLAPLVVPYDPNATEVYNRFQPPGAPNHVLGTDDLGRDMLARLAYGGRISLAVGLSVAGASAVIGGLLGCVAGLYGGVIDAVISRIIDVVLSIPLLPLLMVISGFMNVGPLQLIVAMALLGWMGVGRLVRAQVLTLRDCDFVLAARVVGSGNARIIRYHLLPNVLAPLTVATTLGVAWAILIESAMSYLGFGIHPPTATWGNMLQSAQLFMHKAPWMAVLPGALIALTVTSFNFVGDGLRESLDPKLMGRL
jgi:peptide/nickel transport system permease protein